MNTIRKMQLAQDPADMGAHSHFRDNQFIGDLGVGLSFCQKTKDICFPVGQQKVKQHWLRDGFPLSYLAASDSDSQIRRKNFFQTFLERDLPQWGIQIPAATLMRFWTMMAHYHGQTWNASEASRSFGVSDMTVRRYLDILEGVFMIRMLQPWYANIHERQVKSPKVYFRDSGLLHFLH